MGDLIEYAQTKQREEFHYRFSDVVMICHRPTGRCHTIWYIVCPECERHCRFSKTGKHYWHASCVLCGLSWVITPSELHTTEKVDFTKIIGDITI